jgi:hypothetical protein
MAISRRADQQKGSRRMGFFVPSKPKRGGAVLSGLLRRCGNRRVVVANARPVARPKTNPLPQGAFWCVGRLLSTVPISVRLVAA